MPDDSFVDLRLSDYRGKRYVVLYFYAVDFTFVDASELVAFSKMNQDLGRLWAPWDRNDQAGKGQICVVYPEAICVGGVCVVCVARQSHGGRYLLDWRKLDE